jgi:hypothetical protein
MAFFRKSDISMFTAERAQALEQFAEKANDYVRELKPDHAFLSDVMKDGGVGLEMLRIQPWFEQSPLLNHRGNLDLLAGFVAEGADLSFIWPYISSKTIYLFERDVTEVGLHGIHFRMDLKNEASRVEHTCKLANYVFDTTHERQIQRSPISTLTTLTEGVDAAIEAYLDTGEEQRRGEYGFNQEELWRLTRNSPRDWVSAGSEDEIMFRRGVRKMLSSIKDVGGPSIKDLAERIEFALLPLVYNYGYKLKAAGSDNEVVMGAAARRIDVLLDFIGPSPALREALRRQILINLFSAFPDGLEMLQAKREELQGVMSNPVFFDDSMGAMFKKTLAGPVELFSQCKSVEKPDRGLGVIKFLANTPYPVDLNIAIHGFLTWRSGIVHLAHQHQGWSESLDQRVQVNVPRVLGIYLSDPERLGRYSDAAILKLMDHYLDRFTERFEALKKFGPNVDIAVINMPEDYKSFAPVLQARPKLIEPILEMLESRGILTPPMVEWCGFGANELKTLGSRASTKLKRMVLEDSLGF